jgi:glycerol-3-phosphate dehydrogenase
VLGQPRRASTRRRAIGGGLDLPTDDAARAAWIGRVGAAHGLGPARVAGLLERYGSTAEAVAAWCAAGPDRALATLADYSAREIARLCQEELVGTLADLLFRRTDVALSGRLTRAVVAEMAAIAAPALGWSDARAEAEQAAVLTLARRHGVRLDRAAA